MLTATERIRANLAIGSANLALTAASLLNDPLGLLESEDDLIRLGDDIRSAPLVRSRLGLWLTSRHDVSSLILKSSGVVSAPPVVGSLARLLTLPAIPAGSVDPLSRSLTSIDAAAHTRIRRLIQPAFTPRAIEGWRQATEHIAHDLVDAFPIGQPIDLVEQWSAPLPLAVISEMFGIPEADRLQFRRWGDDLALGLD
ncbi:MAG: hypothetical protein ACFCVC_18925, partial [Acidimicrobiia bacterium]